jgi:hypothetical protein
MTDDDRPMMLTSAAAPAPAGEECSLTSASKDGRNALLRPRFHGGVMMPLFDFEPAESTAANCPRERRPVRRGFSRAREGPTATAGDSRSETTPAGTCVVFVEKLVGRVVVRSLRGDWREILLWRSPYVARLVKCGTGTAAASSLLCASLSSRVTAWNFGGRLSDRRVGFRMKIDDDR